MAFAQLTDRESLRDTVTCLQALKPKLYHAGIRGNIARSTLADANEKRDWRIHADFALYADTEPGVDFCNTVYALDSSIIDLCLSVFPWTRFTKHNAAEKLHALMNIRGSIREFIHISDACRSVKSFESFGLCKSCVGDVSCSSVATVGD